MSTEECILCAPATNNQIPLSQIVESFKVIIKLLENQASKADEDRQKAERLESQLQQLETKNSILEEEKKAAQERSDTYKKRFLDAQDAIKTLHEKNLSLSRSSNLSSRCEGLDETTRSCPFTPLVAEKSLSPGTKNLILAPDTCFAEGDAGDVTYISSDEDDFQAEVKKATKSPRRSSGRVSSISPRAKLVKDSFFAKPKSPIRLSKKKDLKPETPKATVDMDETRMDDFEHMDTSVALERPSSPAFTEATAMSDAALLNVCEDWDSIPPSPVLSASKERRMGSMHSFRGSIPKYNIQDRMEDNAKESPSLLPPKMPFSSRLSGKLPLLMSNSLNAEIAKESTESDAWHGGNPLQDSLPLHRLRTDTGRKIQTPEKSKPANTSLDDLFDKTDGDLETTTMLNNTTWNGLNESDEEDEDLDALILQGVGEAKGSFEPGTQRHQLVDSNNENKRPKTSEKRVVTPPSASSRIHRPVFHDSFDVVPSKSKDKKTYKYQEVVRKHDERKKLDGKACPQCEAYYSDLSAEERRAVLRDVCRHKHVNAPPSTPDHFWDVDIPDTQECRRRGYIVDQEDLPTQARQQQQLRIRRKKPLEYSKPKKR